LRLGAGSEAEDYFFQIPSGGVPFGKANPNSVHHNMPLLKAHAILSSIYFGNQKVDKI
jgi:hypothetical protein